MREQFTFGELLRQFRVRNSMSQHTFAEHMGVHRNTTARWERGDCLPRNRSEVLEIASILHLDTEEQEQLLRTCFFLPDATDAPIAEEGTLATPEIYDSSIPYTCDQGPCLIGRDELLKQLVALLCSSPGSFALTGLPGVGKTAICAALVCHTSIQEHFHDGILWVGLGPKPHISSLLGHWGTLLQLIPTEIEPLTTVDAWVRNLHTRIGKRRMLLIIDDAWTLDEAVLFRLGGSCCTHLLTTRFPALARAFADEQITVVPAMTEKEALLLLEHLAPSIISNHEKEAQKLLEKVDGLPLAITLLGRYLRVQACSGPTRRVCRALERLSEHVTERLQIAHPYDIREGATGSQIGTSRSLQRTIEMSATYLSPSTQLALQALSAFPAKPNTFSEAAVLAVTEQPDETLDQLVDAGLLEYLPHLDRYQLHQTIADYASHQNTDREMTTNRFIKFFIAFAQQNRKNMQAIEQEFSNILAAFDACRTYHLPAVFIDGVLAMVPFIETRRLYALADSLFPEALQVAQAENNGDSQAYLWFSIGKMAEFRSSLRQAEHAYLQALHLAKSLSNEPLIARLLIAIASILEELGEYTQTQNYLSEAQRILETIGDLELLSILLKQQGEIYDTLGHGAKADECYQQGLAIALNAFALPTACTLLQNMGVKAERRGHYDLATAFYQEGLQYAREIDDIQRQSAILMNMGMLSYEQQHYDLAFAYSEESLSLARQIGNRTRIGFVLQNLGIFERTLGNYAQATTYFQESLEQGLLAEEKWLINETQIEWAMLSIKQQRWDEAKTTIEPILTWAREVGAPYLLAGSLFGLAQIAAHEHQPSLARQYAQESIVIYEKLGDTHYLQVQQWLAEYLP